MKFKKKDFYQNKRERIAQKPYGGIYCIFSAQEDPSHDHELDETENLKLRQKINNILTRSVNLPNRYATMVFDLSHILILEETLDSKVQQEN